MNQKLLCPILVLLMSTQPRLSSSCSSFSPFDTNPDRFSGLLPSIRSSKEQISQAQLITKVRITKIYGDIHKDDKMYAAQVICNLKGIMKQSRIKINVSQVDRICQVIHKHTKLGDDVIVFMNQTNRVGSIWNLNSPGMFSIKVTSNCSWCMSVSHEIYFSYFFSRNGKESILAIFLTILALKM